MLSASLLYIMYDIMHRRYLNYRMQNLVKPKFLRTFAI